MDTNVEETHTVLAEESTDGIRTDADTTASRLASSEGQQEMDASKTSEGEQEVVAKDIADPEPEAKQEPAQDIKEEVAEVSVPPSDAELTSTLLGYLKEDTFTMDITERQLRNRLEKHFGVPLKDRKSIIRDKVAI